MLFLSSVLLLTGCAGDGSPIQKAVCTVKQEVVDLFQPTYEKKPVCSGSFVKGCQPVVYFDSGSYELSDEMLQNLDWAVSKMEKYDRYNVDLTGHADKTGEKTDNLRLSEKRVKAVRDYLVDLGIDEQRIKISFKGDNNPVCEEEFCNELSRRVELNLYSVNTDFSDFADFVTTNVFHNQKNEE